MARSEAEQAMKISGLFNVLVAITIVVSPSVGAAKEYNKRTHLAPEQRAKVDRVIAKSRNQGAGQPGDVSNVGCGKLEIGNTKPEKSHRRIDRDNVVVVTGDVINVAQGCRNKR
jgi:hypothetical protein